MTLSTFLHACWPFACLVWKKCLFSSFVYFYWNFLILIYLIYILDTDPLSDIWSTDFFSDSVCCIFIWFRFLYCAFQFDVITLTYFCFCWLGFLDCIQEIIAKVNVKSFYPMLSSRNYIVSVLIVSQGFLLSQGMPHIASYHWKLGGRHGTNFFLGPHSELTLPTPWGEGAFLWQP